MRLLIGFLSALTTLASVAPPAAAEPQEWHRGHITVGGPWVRQRSTNVLLARDSIDGFFYPAPTPPDADHVARVTATVARNGTCEQVSGCVDYDLNINFHRRPFALPTADLPWPAPAGLPPAWITGCTGTRGEAVSCDVPPGAFTGEVVAELGADLDVVVTVEMIPRR